MKDDVVSEITDSVVNFLKHGSIEKQVVKFCLIEGKSLCSLTCLIKPRYKRV